MYRMNTYDYDIDKLISLVYGDYANLFNIMKLL